MASSRYSSIKCHMVLQKSFLNADLLAKSGLLAKFLQSLSPDFIISAFISPQFDQVHMF